MKKIVIVEEKNIHFYPPLMNIVQILLDEGYEVTLVSQGADSMPEWVMNNSNYHAVMIKARENRSNVVTKFFSRLELSLELCSKTKKCMMDADILWTVSVQTVRDMWKTILKYRNVLQLMELCEEGYFALGITFPLDLIARQSWKTVVAEKNRAYIQKAWWGLDDLPYVLPNKPYCLDYGVIDDNMQKYIDKMQNEKRKILLYLGGIFADRELELFAKTIYQRKDEYVLYVVGRAYKKELEEQLTNIINKYDVEYAGYYDAPKHLAFIKHAFVGLLPYKTIKVKGQSVLNALYCAPNKIFEYAGFGVPMVGSDVLGLREPFEKYGIGFCWDGKELETFFDELKKIENNYQDMRENCKKYYDSVDLNQIIKEIVED